VVRRTRLHKFLADGRRRGGARVRKFPEAAAPRRAAPGTVFIRTVECRQRCDLSRPFEVCAKSLREKSIETGTNGKLGRGGGPRGAYVHLQAATPSECDAGVSAVFLATAKGVRATEEEWGRCRRPNRETSPAPWGPALTGDAVSTRFRRMVLCEIHEATGSGEATAGLRAGRFPADGSRAGHPQTGGPFVRVFGAEAPGRSELGRGAIGRASCTQRRRLLPPRRGSPRMRSTSPRRSLTRGGTTDQRFRRRRQERDPGGPCDRQTSRGSAGAETTSGLTGVEG